MADRSITWAAAELASHLAHRVRLVEIIVDDDPASPGAQSFEQSRVSGHSTVLWCEEHEMDPADCHREGRWAGDTQIPEDQRPHVMPARRTPCVGEVVQMATDTVGELVVSGRTGRSKALLAQIEAAEAMVIKGVTMLDRLHERWGPAPPVPLSATARGVARDGDPGCQSCARLEVDDGSGGKRPWWTEPLYNQGRPTDLGGQLPTRLLLCKECYAWALNHDHSQCLLHNDGLKKAKGKVKPSAKIRFSGPVHLPPVSGAFESLDLRHRTGYWRGLPGRTIPIADGQIEADDEDGSPEARRQRRRERLARPR